MTDQMSRQRWQRLALITLTILIAISPRIISMNIPLISDEGAYAYIADTLRNGGLPYRDAFDHKPPLIYFLFSIAFTLFGHGVAAPRLLAMVFTIVSCLLILIIIRRSTGNLAAALFGTMLFGLSTVSRSYIGFAINTEIFTLPFILGGVLLLNEDDPPPRALLLAGLLFGTGFIIKQPVALIAAGAFVMPGLRRLQQSISRFFTALALFTLGSIIPLAVISGYFALQGAFSDFWAASFTYNFGYMNNTNLKQSLWGLYATMGGIVCFDTVTWGAGIGGLVLLLRTSRSRREKGFLALLLAGTTLAVAMGRSFKCYYFVLLVPILAITAGIGLAELLNRTDRRSVLAGGFALTAIAYGTGLWLIPTADMPLHRWITLGPYFKLPLQSHAVGDYLRRTAPRDARLFILGSEASLHYYAELPGASRIFYFWPLVMQSRMKEALQQELLADLTEQPPDYVVVINEAYSLGLGTVAGNHLVTTLFNHFADYKLIGVVADSDAELLTDNQSAMETAIAQGTSMLVLARPKTSNHNGRTLGELLGTNPTDRK